MIILRILFLSLLFISASASASSTCGGKSADTAAHCCAAIGPYYLYMWDIYPTSYTCRSSVTSGTVYFNNASNIDTPGSCPAGKVIEPSGECVNPPPPLSCVYPYIENATHTECVPTLNCTLPKVMTYVSVKDGNVNGVACINPADAVPGAAGSPPKADGTCAPGLVVNGGTCVIDQSGTSGGGAGSDSPSAGSPGNPPKPDGTCNAPLVPDPASGLCHPNCPAGTEGIGEGGSTQTTFCSGSCLYKISARACSTVSACGLYGTSTGASCTQPPDTGCPPGSSIQLTGGQNFCQTTPSDTGPGLEPGGGCQAGYHNNNGNPPSCVPNTLSCVPGTHEVVFGGGVGPVCVSDTSSTGDPGTPPHPDGTCGPGLLNINGVCMASNTASGGSVPAGTATEGTLASVLQGIGQMLGLLDASSAPSAPGNSAASTQTQIDGKNAQVTDSMNGLAAGYQADKTGIPWWTWSPNWQKGACLVDPEYKGVHFIPNLCEYVQKINELLGWLLAVYTAWNLFGIVFKKGDAHGRRASR